MEWQGYNNQKTTKSMDSHQKKTQEYIIGKSSLSIIWWYLAFADLGVFFLIQRLNGRL